MTTHERLEAELRELHELLFAPRRMLEGTRRDRELAEKAYEALPAGPARARGEAAMMAARQRDAMASLFLAQLAVSVSQRLEALVAAFAAPPAHPVLPSAPAAAQLAAVAPAAAGRKKSR
jgi:hypothetical protein